MSTPPRVRARDLGIAIGEGTPGPLNAITDIAGVRVGHTTLISGDGPLVVGKGPVRTGVTVITAHDRDTWAEPVFAGTATMNGNGELTGLEWVREAGLLSGPIGITNTSDVGKVRDALVTSAEASHDPTAIHWSLPVAGETSDGRLNDIAGGHVRAEHVRAALAAASGGPVAEGNVGGGTGMICHEFKGGNGTASRRLGAHQGGWTVGVLVQANYGRDTASRTAARAPARSSGSSRPMRRCCPTSAPGSRAARRWAWRGSVASGPRHPATSSCASPRATGTCPRPRLTSSATAWSPSAASSIAHWTRSSRRSSRRPRRRSSTRSSPQRR